MELRSGTPEEVGMSPSRVKQVVDLARGWVEDGITPALVVLVARKGVVVVHEAFGRLTPEPDSPLLARDSIFAIASLTKPITATAAMILVEEGRLGLNRPVQWYIPEFVGEGKEAVMVHHLLTHTSGLRGEDVNAHAEQERGTVEIPPHDATQHPLIHEGLHLRYDAPLWKPPGTEMSYCNYGYMLLGEIVRRVSGQSLADFARERIFSPLGMVDTHYIVPDEAMPRIVVHPEDAPGALFNTQEFRKRPHAAGGVHSTAIDMAVFGQMFLDRGTYGGARILCPASVAEMTRNQIPGIGSHFEDEFFPEASWGLGWSTRENKNAPAYAETLHSQRAFAHGGWGGVFIWGDPAYDLVGIYFSVASKRGLPVGIQQLPARFGHAELLGRPDLFVNAVTAAIVDM